MLCFHPQLSIMWQLILDRPLHTVRHYLLCTCGCRRYLLWCASPSAAWEILVSVLKIPKMHEKFYYWYNKYQNYARNFRISIIYSKNIWEIFISVLNIVVNTFLLINNIACLFCRYMNIHYSKPSLFIEQSDLPAWWSKQS